MHASILRHFSILLFYLLAGASCRDKEISSIQSPVPIMESGEPLSEISVTTVAVPITLSLTTLEGLIRSSIPSSFDSGRVHVEITQAVINDWIHIRGDIVDVAISMDSSGLRVAGSLHGLFSAGGTVSPPWPLPDFDVQETAVFKASFDLGATPTIGEDWSISPNVNASIQVHECSLELLNHIPVTAVRDTQNALNGKKDEIESAVAEAIRTSIDLRGEGQKVWDQIYLSKVVEGNPTFTIKVTPHAIQSSPLTYGPAGISAVIGIEAHVDVSLGNTAPDYSRQPLPRLSPLRASSGVLAYLPVNIRYDKAAEALTAYARANPELTLVDRSVQVVGASLTGKGKRICVGIDLVARKGMFGKPQSAKVYLVGDLVHDPLGRQLRVENLDYDLQTRDLLFTVGEWFLHPEIRDRVREILVVDLANMEAQLISEATQQLSNVELPQNVSLERTVESIKLHHVFFSDDALIGVFELVGQIAVKL